jgi:integrase
MRILKRTSRAVALNQYGGNYLCRMSTRRIRNTWWVDFRCEGIRYRKRSPENSQIGARAFEIVLRQRLARGEPIDGKKAEKAVIPTFKEFSDQWYDTYVQTNNKASEQKAKRVTLNAHLLPFFGREKLDEITNRRIEEYKAEKLKKGLSPKTINNHLTVLSTCLHCAQEWIGLQRVTRIVHLKVPPQKFDYLSPEESQALLSSIEDPMWFAMVLVALRTGLRLGELAALEWSDVNFETRLLTVSRSIVRGVVGPPKSNRVRHIPFTQEVVDALVSLRSSQGLVFHRTESCAMNHETPRKNLIKMCKAAGIRKIGWHTLRHSFASHLVAAGASMKAVQELLGHNDIRTTMRYAHLAPSALREAVALLDRSRSERSPNCGQPVGNVVSSIFTPDKKKASNQAFLMRSLVAGVGIEPQDEKVR